MYTLGINAAFHDFSACLVQDGKVLAAAEDERFSHIKHGKRPTPFIMKKISTGLQRVSLSQPTASSAACVLDFLSEGLTAFRMAPARDSDLHFQSLTFSTSMAVPCRPGYQSGETGIRGVSIREHRKSMFNALL